MQDLSEKEVQLDEHHFYGIGAQSKAGILKKQGLAPLVVGLPAAAAMLDLSENAARPLFEAYNVPVLEISPTRRGIRVADIERLLDLLAKEVE